MTEKHVKILGTRGIPAAHGGFETFAEQLARYLVERDWRVSVFCQHEGRGSVFESEWHGIRLVNVPGGGTGAASTVIFDWRAALRASNEGGINLVLGYNTAIFSALFHLFRRRSLMNMDGIEWRRDKWSGLEKIWLYMNERFGCWFSNHLIADHPEIANHLARHTRRNKITMIPYGADEVSDADPSIIREFGLEPGEYLLVVARAEPENSILEIVRAFSARERNCKLVLLGHYDPKFNRYHRKIRSAANLDVVFPGAIYDKTIVEALRFHTRLYLHGHRVGGTNPSLVEALAAGSPVLVHDNRFNRWVAGDQAVCFRDEYDCDTTLTQLLESPERLEVMSRASRDQFRRRFTWDRVLGDYERLLRAWL